MRRLVLLAAVPAVVVGPRLAAQGSPAEEPTRVLYRAAVAAADASLRLHETDRAKYWLALAPERLRGWEWSYLSLQADGSSTVIAVGQSNVLDVDVSPDGRLIASAGSDGSVVVTDAATRKAVHALRSHKGAVWTAAFSPDGRALASAASDGMLRIWDVASGRETRAIADSGQGVSAAAWSPDGTRIAVVSWRRTRERGVWGTINVYDGRNGESLHRLEYGDKPIGSVAFSPDGATLVVGTWDSDAVVYDAQTWRQLGVLRPPPSTDYKAVRDLAISPDGKHLAVAHHDHRVRVWSLGDRRLTSVLYAPAEGLLKEVHDVAFLPDGQRLVTVGGDLTVRLWDVAAGTELATWHGHDRAVNAVATAPGGRVVYTASADGTLRIWDLEATTSREAWRLPHTAYTVAFAPDRKQAAVATWEGWLRIIDVSTGRAMRAWQGHEQSAVGVDWSADGRWLASTGNDGRVVLWNAATGTLAKELGRLSGQILSVAFHPTAPLVASAGADGAVDVWRVPSGERAHSLTGGSAARAGYITWSVDGRSLAAGSSDGSVRVWDVPQGSLRHRVDGSPGSVGVAFHPRGDRLAVGNGRTVRILDVATGREVASFAPRSASITSLDYSPDGERLAVGLANNTFEILDSEHGDMLLRLPVAGSAWNLRWTKGGELALIPLDQTVRVLRAASASRPTAASAPASSSPSDSAWQWHLQFLARGSGVWVTSNAAYRTADNGEPPEYAQRYWMGFGGTTQHGCLWGIYSDKRPIYWRFFTGWDPTRQRLLVQQSSEAGVVGIGYEDPATGIAEQTFTRPDGTAWVVRHVTEKPTVDTLVTQSFERAGGEWQLRRTYTWVRQPTRAGAVCR